MTVQLSRAVAVPSATFVAVQPLLAVTLRSAGQTMDGGWLSSTSTNCWQVLVLPLTSMAFQVTRLRPTGYWLGASLVTLRMPQLSLTVGAVSTTLVAKH